MAKISDKLVLRALESSDHEKSFLPLLAQLTKAPEIPKERWNDIFNKMRSSGSYFTVVVENTEERRIVATATLLTEYKFLRGGGLAGHIEDVVVDASLRGKNVGARLMAALQDIGKKVGCYKVILDCSEDNVKFYERCGFQRKEVQMAVYFPENAKL
ncbi:hypothetical protein GUITHDRAFT_89759 [Guillardia theta CCMP2712]|uniref:Glucosamine 6-phosphate N-acetyltransferase n=1 Tax=Guillardia theta (strain CCMP2712) TaxID=905079 RepID=L1IN50_GUITC|nr:hypothetical protein GUITHDRAFT_89759 [Guillardia theta CCMP2712]EKX37225.1 hypothetical protein GUITHDRAFT_89759 [Guillardia theta CCMP2712]|eukprot:XP_005824205.1 hypothetical protein GUITHDRAFT_89759 [Guillardia theta CCMP2712]